MSFQGGKITYSHFSEEVKKTERHTNIQAAVFNPQNVYMRNMKYSVLFKFCSTDFYEVSDVWLETSTTLCLQ